MSISPCAGLKETFYFNRFLRFADITVFEIKLGYCEVHERPKGSKINTTMSFVWNLNMCYQQKTENKNRPLSAIHTLSTYVCIRTCISVSQLVFIARGL